MPPARGRVPPDLIKALSAKELNGACHAFHAPLCLARSAASVDLEYPAADDTELGVTLEALDQRLEVAFPKGDVRVEVADVGAVRLRKRLDSLVDGIYLRGRVPLGWFVNATEVYERVIRRITTDDIVRPSVEPSLTITHICGFTVWATTDSSVSWM